MKITILLFCDLLISTNLILLCFYLYSYYACFLIYLYICNIDSKEAEAAQSAYYDPNVPQTAYVPPPAYYVNLKFLIFLKI